MNKIASLVISGEATADIGTDHGYIPAYLLSNGICPKVILTDVNPGPLERAKLNFINYSVSGGDFRLGNGLEVIQAHEVSTVIIAGMGGELIESILKADSNKSLSFKKIILQPRTRSDELRIKLNDIGFTISEYKLAKEKDRICEIYSIAPGKGAYENPIISDILLKTGDPLLQEFIAYKIKTRQTIIDNLSNSNDDKSDEISKYQIEIDYLESI